MRVAVIGAGVFGSWAAKFLADAGHAVTLIDAYGPANGRASSADHSRVIRSGYGADEIYSRWAADAWQDWQWLSDAAGEPLVTRTGALFMGPADSAYIRDTYATLTRLNLRADLLDLSELPRRFPQIDTTNVGAVMLEHDAGVIRARRSVQALVRLLRDREVEYLEQRVDLSDEQRSACVVRTSDGATLGADVYVCACGPWLPSLLPQAVGGRIRATRQEVLYFGIPAASQQFSAPRFPVWIDFAAGLYGIPDLDGRGFKVGVDRHGPAIDPDTLDRVVTPDVIEETRSWIGGRFPGMRRAPLVDARVCQYENSSTGDFIIDRHPMWPQCWIVGGGSGHGFKHGPAVGRHLAALIDGSADVQPRFSLATKAIEAARAVY